MDRAEKYVRLDGKLNFGAGSQAADVIDVIRDYGLVPNEAMTGMNYGTELPAQSELDAVLLGYVSAVAKNPNRTSPPHGSPVSRPFSTPTSENTPRLSRSTERNTPPRPGATR